MDQRDYCHEENDEELREKVWKDTYDKAYAVASSANPNKHERIENFGAVCDEFIAANYPEDGEEVAPTGLIKKILSRR